MNRNQIVQEFQSMFETAPDAVSRAPGRVNLIGEHIDYNGGPVFPIALGKQFLMAGKKRDDNRVRIRSRQFEDDFDGAMPVAEKQSPDWANYPLGVFHELQKLGLELPGIDLLATSDVPVASGLSSSAAFEVATAVMMLHLIGHEMLPLEIAQLCQRAENQFVGMNCGLMDQAASACCKANHALLLDCAKPAFSWHPLPDAAVVVAHSGVHRGLTASAYNERRSQCFEALDQLNAAWNTEYKNLCEISPDKIEHAEEILSGVHWQRCRHVMSEAERVIKTLHYFSDGDLKSAGEQLNQSHYSLRDDYEVSCPELDELTECCRTYDGVFGSRLTGAGFGGCAIALVDNDRADALIEHVKTAFYQKNGLEALVFATQAADGAGIVNAS